MLTNRVYGVREYTVDRPLNLVSVSCHVKVKMNAASCPISHIPHPLLFPG